MKAPVHYVEDEIRKTDHCYEDQRTIKDIFAASPKKQWGTVNRWLNRKVRKGRRI